MERKHKKLYNGLINLGFFQEKYKQSFNESKYKENDDDIIKQKLAKFLTNSESRLSLMEWLIAKYDSNLLGQFKLAIENSDLSERIKRIYEIFSITGVLYQNKYSRNADYKKLIEGTLGLEASLNFLLRILKFVESANEIELKDNAGKRKEDEFYLKLMNECCLKKKDLIIEDANLFPMTFPRIEMENSKINDKISIRDKIIDHEQELEEKALEINENMINPYEDFMLDFENRQGLKSEFKTQINLFENNYNRLLELKPNVLKFEKDVVEEKNKIIFSKEYQKKLKKIMEIRKGDGKYEETNNSLLNEIIAEKIVFRNIYDNNL